MSQEINVLTSRAKDFSTTLQGIQLETSKVIVGQDKIIEKLIIVLLSRGHVLLKGVPGLAKTLLFRLSDFIESSFVRLQFTPNLFLQILLVQKFMITPQLRLVLLKAQSFQTLYLQMRLATLLQKYN